jgi:hypothetical protein
MDSDPIPDVDRHQIFTEFNGPGVILSYKRKYGSGLGIVVRKYREFRLHALEYLSGFQSVRVMIAD